MLYSDSCGGQNRNINIVVLWLYIVASSDFSYEVIDHKFMVSGHSYLPNDRDFGSIEIAKRQTQYVYVPADWRSLIFNARKKNPFIVREMKTEHFLAIKNLMKYIVNRKKNTDGEKVNWLQFIWIRVEKSSPLMYKYRLTHNELEPWKQVDLKPRQRGRPANIGVASMLTLYQSSCPINKKKLNDLMELLKFIPPVYHTFYHNLKESTATGHNDEQVDYQEDDDEENGDE